MDADTLVEADALQKIVRPLPDGRQRGGSGRQHPGGQRLSGSGRSHAGGAGPPHRFGRFSDRRVSAGLLAGPAGLEPTWAATSSSREPSDCSTKQSVLDSGGYAHDTVGEDMELVVRLRRQGVESKSPRRIAFIPDPVAWTEVPESRRVLGRQRDRWHRGLADVLWRHKGMLLNPRYGSMGMLTVPCFWIIELLAPVIEAFGLVMLAVGLITGAINFAFAGLFFVTAYGYGLLLSIACILLEDVSFHRYTSGSDRLWLILWAVLENLGYRQLTVWWRLQGLWKFARGRTDWGAMERKGFKPKAAAGK